MIKHILMSLLFWPRFIYSQADTTDLDYSPLANPVLKGTTVLSSSPKNVSAWNMGYYLDSIHSSDCDNLESKPKLIHEIVDITWNGDTIEFSTKVNANCCYSFLGEIEILNDTLNLIYHGYGGLCGCTCCFGLKYSISVLKTEDSPEIRFAMMNDDHNSIKKIEK